MPDFTGNVRYDSDFGHVQVSGILRKLTFQPSVGEDMNQLGYGISLTGDFHPWAWLASNPERKDNPTAMERCRILGQYAVGRGINRYLQDPNGLGLDAVFLPIGGFVPLTPMVGSRATSTGGRRSCSRTSVTAKCWSVSPKACPATRTGAGSTPR